MFPPPCTTHLQMAQWSVYTRSSKWRSRHRAGIFIRSTACFLPPLPGIQTVFKQDSNHGYSEFVYGTPLCLPGDFFKVLEISAFHCILQWATNNAFFTALRTMVKFCDYHLTDVEERLIQNRFLVDLLERKLSNQLCQNPRVTLHEALTHNCQHEDADNERKACDSADSLPLAIDATRLCKRKPAPADKPTQLCPFCGHAPHPCADCPARGLVVIPKISGGYRLCVDLTRLNKVVLRERHVLPTVEQCLGVRRLLGLVNHIKHFNPTFWK